MTTIQRFNDHLKSLTALTAETEKRHRDSGITSQQWPAEINLIRRELLDNYHRLGKLETEIETDLSDKARISKSLSYALDKLRDLLQIFGDDGHSLILLQVTSYDNLEVFIDFIIRFSEVFQQVIEQLPNKQFANFYDIIDRARKKREGRSDGI